MPGLKVAAKPFIKSKFRALGTDINVRVVLDSKKEKSKARLDIERIKNIFKQKQRVFCRFNSRSELSKLNKNFGVFQRASADMLYLAKRALNYHRKSGGLYDPRTVEILEKIGYGRDFKKSDFSKVRAPRKLSKIGGSLNQDLKIKDGRLLFKKRMDFSGIAKGYITDCAAKFLKKKGWKNFLINSGGDMYAAGLNHYGKKWEVPLEGVSKDKMTIKISNEGVATSGISRKKWQIKGKKFHHLINPKNPNRFSFEIQTVLVIDKSAEGADGQAKVLVLMGKERGLKFSRENKIKSVFLDNCGNIFMSSMARKHVSCIA